MSGVNTCTRLNPGGVTPKGYPSIGAPGALYAFDLSPFVGKAALLPAYGGQTALRSYER